MLLLVTGVVALGVAIAALVSLSGARRVRTSERLASINEYGFARERSRSKAAFHDEPRPNPIATVSAVSVASSPAALVTQVRRTSAVS